MNQISDTTELIEKHSDIITSKPTFSEQIKHQLELSHRFVLPTILSGGSGSRLWPLSRTHHPKPFIRLTDGQSLLQKAFLRGAALPGATEVLIVAHQALVFKIEDELHEINTTGISTPFILEPLGRNTAAAITTAALHVAKEYGENTIMLILAADHLIADQGAFLQAVKNATELAANGKLVTFGISPETPETRYGYIEAEGNRVVNFVEKPSREKAKQYLAQGRFFWNSGMFCFSATTLLQQMKKHCPHILFAAQNCLNLSPPLKIKGKRLQLELDPETFAKIPEDSIDYALMESAATAEPLQQNNPVAVIPCNMGWSDVGSWTALGDLTIPDDQGNRITGEAIVHDTKNCTIQSHHRLIGTVGIHDLIIVETPDAVLVAERSRAEDVKHLYANLKAKNHQTHQHHVTTYRPWGSYTIIEEGLGFKIKRIEVKPRASLSLQMHHHRSEHWVVVQGTAHAMIDQQEIILHENESSFISAGKKHRLSNPTDQLLVIIEIQCGGYLGEDDIVRFEDPYDR